MKKSLTVFFLACISCAAIAQDNVIDEIVWVVGDDAILRSDVAPKKNLKKEKFSNIFLTLYCTHYESNKIKKTVHISHTKWSLIYFFRT